MDENKRFSICEYCATCFDSHMMGGLTADDCQCRFFEVPNGNKERWLEICKKTKKCRYCRPHSGCNCNRH